MSFRDDRDALLAQADALRRQLADAEAALVEARRVAEDAKAAGIAEDADAEARLWKEIERLREQVDALRAAPAPAPAPTAAPEPKPKPNEPDPRPAAFGSTIRAPAPDLPPAGNPAMALVAVLLILGAAAAFALIALSG